MVTLTGDTFINSPLRWGRELETIKGWLIGYTGPTYNHIQVTKDSDTQLTLHFPATALKHQNQDEDYFEFVLNRSIFVGGSPKQEITINVDFND